MAKITPQAIIDLRIEIQNHVELAEKIKTYGPRADFESILAYIALWCGVVLDGVYSGQDVIEICNKLTKELVKKREGRLIDVSAVKLPIVH